MSSIPSEPRWKRRLSQIESPVEEIHLPEDGGDLSQDREWFDVVVDGETRRLLFHDYDEIYKVPGLYERLFYERLECNSPTRVAALLDDVLTDFDDEHADLTPLDVGAGNGIVGEELHSRGADSIVGIDIIPEAREAAERDRPEVYDDYLVTDLTDLPEPHEEALRERQINCLTTVAALGFGDIPPRAFLKALDVCETPAWLAFNIKEDFLRENDSSGFTGLIRQLAKDEVIQIQAYRRYRHRLSMTGKPLHYVAMIARKIEDVPDHIMDAH